MSFSLDFRFNHKLDRFVLRYRDNLVETMKTLMAQWDQYTLIYALSVLKLLSHLLCRIGVDGIKAIGRCVSQPDMTPGRHFMVLFQIILIFCLKDQFTINAS